MKATLTGEQEQRLVAQAKKLGMTKKDLLDQRVKRLKGRELRPLHKNETPEDRCAAAIVATDAEFVEYFMARTSHYA